MGFDDLMTQGGEWLAIFGAGFFAGAINVVVGSGTLVSFPVLVLLGYPPVVANMSNTIGLVPGSISGVIAYRRELLRRSAVIRVLLPASAVGGIAGALVLLVLPAGVFSAVVPWLIGIGVGLVLLGPALKRAVTDPAPAGVRASVLPTSPGAGPVVQAMDTRRTTVAGPLHAVFATKAALLVAVFGAFLLGIYGGYFGAAQGILLIGLLGVLSQLDLQELNGIKNLVVLAVNLIAAVVFTIVSPGMIDWVLAGLIAAGAACGGLVGGRFAKRLSPRLLRTLIITVGVATIVFMIATN
ncbi:sulfite exporter TauE/SafE family protein [Arthrobacter sp. USHLN218]|uniref:sulfite exporter TauE/SafE family protein n=1 Tax=Arthrobacter sp. USHLN218 TaxID=3081232 RepID=UPI003018F80F